MKYFVCANICFSSHSSIDFPDFIGCKRNLVVDCRRGSYGKSCIHFPYYHQEEKVSLFVHDSKEDMDVKEKSYR